jgi:hypothetical protein
MEEAMTPVIRHMLFAGVLILAILACNLPIAAPPADPGAVFTAAALTVAAAVNQTLVPLPSQIPLASPLPSVPPADTFTPLPTLSPTPVLTSTPSIPLISVSVDTNCRVGPGKIYDLLGGLLVGETAEVYAKNPGGDYWYIRNPDNSNSFCWVWGQYATLVGNTTILPVYTPPPTPTPVPNFELSYAGLDSCVGWWVELLLKNTGPLTFKSFSLSVKDTDTGTVLTNFGNGFTDNDGCLASGITASLDPGDSYTISAPVFVYNPNNHKIRATVTLCTLANQTGQCISHTIEFKP